MHEDGCNCQVNKKYFYFYFSPQHFCSTKKMVHYGNMALLEKKWAFYCRILKCKTHSALFYCFLLGGLGRWSGCQVIEAFNILEVLGSENHITDIRHGDTHGAGDFE